MKTKIGQKTYYRKNCLVCDKEFLTVSKRAKNCSLSCTGKNNAKRLNSMNSKGWFLGKRHSEETKKKISLSRTGKCVGEQNHAWIKDRKQLKVYDDRRDDYEYKVWRKKVYTRDGFQCKINDVNCKGKIEAHHILNWLEYPELRYQTNNGITLCHAHHPKGRAKEKRLIPTFKELVSVLSE